MGHNLVRFSAFVESGGGLGTIAHSTARLSTEVSVPVHVRGAIATRHGWSAGPGTTALTGTVELPGLCAEFAFRTRSENDPEPAREGRATATIVKAGYGIPVPTQRVALAAHPESQLWVKVQEPDASPSCTEQFVGRCAGRPLAFDLDVPVHCTLQAWFTPEESPDWRRTRIDMGGELRFERGARVRLLSRAAAGAGPSPPEFDAGEAVLLPPGTAVPIEKRVVWGNVGPNPWISVRILGAGGRMLGGEHLLGRSMRFQ